MPLGYSPDLSQVSQLNGETNYGSWKDCHHSFHGKLRPLTSLFCDKNQLGYSQQSQRTRHLSRLCEQLTHTARDEAPSTLIKCHF